MQGTRGNQTDSNKFCRNAKRKRDKEEREKERKKEKERERKERRQEDGKNRQERERQSEKAFTGEKQTGTVSKESRHEKTRKKTRKKIRKKTRENRRRQYSEKPAGKAARQTEKFSLRNAQRAQGMLQVVFAPASDGGGHRRT